MLEIVLLILKIAGIIIAAILGILIVGLCCALFVPVRYRGDFSVSDGEDDGKKNIGAVLRATWLLRFVRVYVSYEEAVRVRVKVFFFTLLDTAKEKKNRKKKKKQKKVGKEKGTMEESSITEKEAADIIENSESEEVKDKKSEETKDKNSEEAKDKKPEEIKGSRFEGVKDNRHGNEPDKETEKDGSKDKSSSKEKKSIKKRISNILQTIRNFCDKLKKMKEKTGEFKAFWNSDHMVSSRGLLWRELLYLLKHTKPRKLEGYLRFGFDDPSTTGYAMAVYGILCSIWSPELSVEPDFEKQVLEGHIKIKGKIRACHFVKTVLKLFFSRDVRRVVHDFKRL